MSRRPRQHSDTGIYHVLNRGVDRQSIFFDDCDRIAFGRLLAELHDEWGVATLVYCLMGNHYHLLLRDTENRLSAAMHHLASNYVRRTNDRIGRDGPMFRDRFRSIPVTTDEYLLWVSKYIHENPLAISGVDHIADYRWSSYRAYLGLRRPPHFLDRSVLLDYFEGDIDAFALFSESAEYRFPAHTPVNRLADFVELAVNLEAISSPVGAPTHAAATLKSLLVERGVALESQNDGAKSPAALRAARWRARQRYKENESVRRMYDRLVSFVTPAA